jgi:hypothetical protein
VLHQFVSYNVFWKLRLVHDTYKGHIRLKIPQLPLPIPRLRTNLNLALHRQDQQTFVVCDGVTIRWKIQAYQLETTVVAVPSLLLGEPSADLVEIPFSLAASWKTASWPSQDEDGLV